MFNPPTATGRVSGYDIPVVSYQEPSPLPLDSAPLTPTPVRAFPRLILIVKS